MTGVMIVWAFLALGLLLERVTDLDGRTIGAVLALCVVGPMWACDDDGPGASDASVTVDGSMCTPFDRRLYELDFAGSGCGDVRSRVRRLDGPSGAGHCVSDVDPRACGLWYSETCELPEGGTETIEGEIEWDDSIGWYVGRVEVERFDAEGELECFGDYSVTIEVVR